MSIWLLTAIYVPLKSRRFSLFLLILNCIIISFLNSSFCRCVCVCACTCLRMCMYDLCMHAHVHVCAYASVCTFWRPEVDSGCLFLFIFWDRVCYGAYLSWIVRLASRSSRVCLSLAHCHWGFRPVQSCLTFTWVVDLNSGPQDYAAKLFTYWESHLHSAQHYLLRSQCLSFLLMCNRASGTALPAEKDSLWGWSFN